nr:GNAT family N-acetyltransferase [candidate division Zixibacteria bacterium]
MEIRLITSGEEELCNQFHNRIFKHDRTLLQWRWDFVLNNYRADSIPYAVAVDKGRIVGTQAFIPIRMIDREGVYWTAKSEETLVDPDYRGQRLFEKMYALLFDFAADHGFAHVWGFTPAIKAFERLNFTIPGKTEQIFMPFSTRSVPIFLDKGRTDRKAMVRNSLKMGAMYFGCAAAQSLSSIRFGVGRRRILQNLQIRTPDKPDPQMGEVCKRFIDKWGGTTIYRDHDYLQWRLFDNPYVKGIVRAIYNEDELCGWVAFALGDDGLGYLVDVMAAGNYGQHREEDIIGALLIEAVMGARNMGAVGIRGWHVNCHPFDRLILQVAKKTGFYHSKRGHSVVLYNCGAGEDRVSFKRFDDWYVSRIYTEGVLG